MKQVDHSARSHAFLSASGSSRWMNCTPSALLEKDFPDEPSSYAQEGTLAHEFAELNLKRDLGIITTKQYNKLIAPFKKDPYYSEELEDHVQVHVNYVIQQFQEAKRRTPDARLLIEEQVDFSDLVEGGYGTTDDMIIADKILEVIDYKHGQGVVVSAKKNSQLMLYGYGALSIAELMFDIETVRLTIVQPRKDSISSWEISVDDLKKWAEEEVRPKAILATEGKGELHAGDWCKFCKVKARCRELARHSLEVAKEEFSDPHLLSDKEVIMNYERLVHVKEWAKSVEDYVVKEALKGKNWEGYKLVEGRSNRKITDEERAIEILEEYGYSRSDYIKEKLEGIGNLEKLVGKKNFPDILGEVVEKPKGSPTLVSDDDRRPTYDFGDAKSDFS